MLLPLLFIFDLLHLVMLVDFDAMAQALTVDLGDTGLAVLTALACLNIVCRWRCAYLIYRPCANLFSGPACPIPDSL